MKAQIVVNQRDKKVSLFIENKFYKHLPKSLVSRTINLEELSLEAILNYVNNLENKKAENYLVWLLSKKNYLKSQLLRKLKIRGFKEELVLQLIEKYSALGFLDDSAFLKGIIGREKRKGYGRRAVAFKLRSLGFESHAVQQVLDRLYSPEEEKQVLRQMQAKKGLKTLAFWLRRGFSL